MENKEFNLKEYIEQSDKIDKYLKRKLKHFTFYLKKEMGEDVFNDITFLGILDKEDLLDSLDYYIENTLPSQQAAKDYRRAIIRLIDVICEDYQIENDISSVVAREDFITAANERIVQLPERESRECMSSEEFETLSEAIYDFFDTYNLENLIAKSIIDEHMKPNYFARLVSALVLSLVKKYGIANKVVPNLTVNDLSIGRKTLKVNGIELYLGEELSSYFELYLKSRTMVIQNRNIQTEYLFIKKNGFSYLDVNTQASNSELFLLMSDALEHTNVTSLRYRTVIDLVLKGANINLLSQLTGVNQNTIREKCRDNEIELKERFENLFKELPNSYKHIKKGRKKGYIQCPYCGRENEAISDNWVLIQIDGESEKHIACKKCEGGENGKYKY